MRVNQKQTETSISFVTNIGDLKELLRAFENAFEWSDFAIPSDKYLEKILKRDNFLVVAAKVDNRIIGGLTAYILDGYDVPKPFIYIYDVGIKDNFQNQGIGKKLIEFLREFAGENDIDEMYVSTEEADNEQAISFYRKTSIDSEIKVLQFNYLIPRK